MDLRLRSVRKGIFVNLSLFQFLSFVRRGVFYTFMINYHYKLIPIVTLTTMLGTLDMIASALGQNLLWGKISDRYKLRTKLIIAGESIAAIAYFIVFFVHRSLLDMQANFLAGLSIVLGLSMLEFFWSMSDVGWAALLTDVTTSKTRGGIVGALNFIASLGRMIGIFFSGFLYNEGEGFRQGTIFYIVIVMLFTSATIMWITSKSAEKTRKKAEKATITSTLEKSFATGNEKMYKWFLISLIIIVIGIACINQIFLLFLELPEGFNAESQERSLILIAWNLSGM